MKSLIKKQEVQYLIIYFLSLVTPVVLFFNRQLDDNRLTSWWWVLSETRGYRLLILLGLSQLAAFCVTRLRLQWRPSYLFLSAFLATAFFWSEPEVIVDAARYFTQAKQLNMYGLGHFFSQWGHDVFAWTDLPFVPMLYGLVFRVLGENRIWIQVLNSLFFAGAVILTYRFGKILWDEMLGRYAAFLLLGFPYVFTQVPLMLVDVPSMFFMLLAVYSFTCYLLEGGRKRFVTTSFAILFAVFSKYSLWIYLSVLVIVFMVVFFTRKDRVFIRCFFVFAAVLVFSGLLYLFWHDVMNGQIALLESYQKSGLQKWGESFVSTFLFQTHPLLTATAVLSLGAALMKRDAKYLIISFLVIVVVLLQVKRIRYALPVFPMLALMSSYGINQLRFPETRKLLVASIVFTSLFLSLGEYLPYLHRMSANNLQYAGKYLDDNHIASAGVVLLPQEEDILNPDISLPILDIYTSSDLRMLANEDNKTIDREIINSSPLRFTWEYRLPAYYEENDKEFKPEGLVIIGNAPDQILPLSLKILAQKFKHRKMFETTTGNFTYNTTVTVYH